MDRFARFGITAGVVGGLSLALGAGLTTIGASKPFSQQVVTTAFVIATVLRLVGGIGLLLGVSGITARCIDRGGRLLLAGYLFAVVGLVLNLGWIWSDLFISDTLAKVAPAVLDGNVTPAGVRIGIGFMAAWLANLGLVLLAAGVARARTVPRSSWIALLVSGGITVVPLPFDGVVFEAFIGVPFALAMGSALATLRGAKPASDLTYEPAI
jgi:hypothetical protein